MSSSATARSAADLIRRGKLLEWGTLGWNVVGVVVLGFLAASSSSVALLGFGIDSLIEIAASAVVLWELSGTGEHRQRVALRLIGFAFVALAGYLLIQSVVALATQHHASPSTAGIAWTGVTAIVMFGLAFGKTRTGRALDNPVLITEGKVTVIDGILACAVLAGIALDLLFGWWWADPIAGCVIVFYAIREAVSIFHTTAS
jgi:divalent metal cation (Fe/Co/Zn/Cd) transporter